MKWIFEMFVCLILRMITAYIWYGAFSTWFPEAPKWAGGIVFVLVVFGNFKWRSEEK